MVICILLFSTICKTVSPNLVFIVLEDTFWGSTVQLLGIFFGPLQDSFVIEHAILGTVSQEEYDYVLQGTEVSPWPRRL